MNERLRTRLVDVVSPLIYPGEEVRVATRAGVGQVPLMRQVAMAAALSAVTRGAYTNVSRQKVMFAVLTTQRLLLVEPHRRTGRPTADVTVELPVAKLSLVSAKQRLMLTVGVGLAGSDQAMKLDFALVDRKDGRQFATELGRLGGGFIPE